MILREFQVQNFRNLQNSHLNLEPGVTIIQGANAQGKTSLLEAIGMLVMGRSFRTRDERELLPWGAEPGTATLVRGVVGTDSGSHHISVGLQGRRKQVTLDGQPLRRLGDLLGHLRAVIFEPQDMELVQGPPALRRRLLDLLLVQLESSHLENLQRYDSALRHRQSLLRQQAGEPTAQQVSLLETYEAILVEYGPLISSQREEILGHVAQDFCHHYGAILGIAAEKVCLEFLPGWGRDPQPTQSLLETLSRNRESDRVRGSASLGSHRDDFRFVMDGRRAADFASQGQRRTMVLAIKLAEVDSLTRLSGSPPLLLLDDLLSELDHARQRGVLAILPGNTQTIVTTTDATELAVRDAVVLECKKGSFCRT